MTDSVLSHRSELKSNRLDPPHDLMLASSDEDSTAPWMALAGRDPSTTPDQLDRQTSELLAYVQQQNDEIDARQAELNAKLAQLDNELRTARLRSGLDAGEDLIAAPESGKVHRIDSGIALDEIPDKDPVAEPSEPSVPVPQPVSTPPPTPERNTGMAYEDSAIENSASGVVARAGTTAEFREFEEVERLVAQFSSLAADVDAEDVVVESEDQVNQEEVKEKLVEEELVEKEVIATEAVADVVNSTDTTPPTEVKQAEVKVPVAKAKVATITDADDPAARIVERLAREKTKTKNQSKLRSDTSHGASVPAKVERIDVTVAQASLPKTYAQMLEANASQADGIDLQAMTTSLETSELESERRLLAERTIELDRRKVMLTQMQDDTQALHREALEMRLVTEQLWIEISDKAPGAHVDELLADLRSKLDEHYNQQRSTIENHESDLLQLKKVIERKQDDLRDQSDKLQQWVETRHDEIKTYAAEVDAREMLLDRRENRMREEFSKWEATRSAYQNQLQGLLGKLGKSSIE